MRVGAWLLALAVVPLTGAVWFAANEVGLVRESSRQAEAVAEATDELVQLTELRATVLDERNWTGAAYGVRDLGISPQLVASFVGIDLDGQQAVSRERVDRLITELDWPEVAAALADVRISEHVSLDQINQEYNAVAAVVQQRSERSLDDLVTIAGDISQGADLVAALRVLDAASISRQAVTLQQTSYFGAQFTTLAVASVELETLVEQRFAYQRAMAEVARIAGPETETVRALGEVESSDDVIAFRTELAELLATPRTISESDVAAIGGNEIDFAAIAGNLDSVAGTFQSATGSVEQHLALVDAAGVDVLAASSSIDDAAVAASRQALLRVGVLAIASLLFAMGLARAIRRPLRQLAAGAEGLRDGNGLAELQPSGPTEIREAMHALNEAAAHLELAERQANALASGQLDDPALSESSPGALGQSLQEAVQTLTSSLSEREELGILLSHEASHDSLTQLPNRRASLDSLHQGLARSKRTGATVAIMFLDLDGFKQVNDHHGHAAGDTVLRSVSGRLTDTLRDGDHVGRLGGDEFLVVAEPIAGAAEAVALAQRLIDSISQPIAVGAASVRIGASIGIALADNETTLTADELLRDADLAVYKAKGSGSSLIQLCDESLRTELDKRADVESALRTAIELDQLTLHYQPIVDAETLQVVSLEALVRWERPGVGLVPPDEFIPTAERSDLILAVDNWVVRNVIGQMGRWSDHDALAHLPVAINVSGRHLGTDDFVNDVLGPLDQTGVQADRVVLEVTESALMQDLDLAAEKLQQLRERGISIAIDDFGTGYTSLAHLRTLPVDILKIDRTFTADTSAYSLVKLIIDTGHLLGLRVIAEGIETAEQACDLAKMGSDELQGFLYGHPVPVAEISLPLSTSARPHSEG
jgi:diguanylate cyclase (GGDEF)-like protein